MEPPSDAARPWIERGGGPPVVFLHGYPLDHRMWESQLVRFSDSHRVVLLDLPGYGLARAEEPADSLARAAEAVDRRLREVGSGPFVVVGHSFGGYVALELFHRHPEHFAHLVLTNTRSTADPADVREKRLATARRLEQPSEGLDIDEVARGLLSPAAWVAGGELRETVRSMVREAPVPTVRATLRALANRPDLTEVLPTIRVPTLVLWGEADRLIPPPESRSMLDQLPRGTGVGLPGVAHLPSLEGPELFGRALADFLGQPAEPR
jgi:3-oxoadipate enol-lactonase